MGQATPPVAGDLAGVVLCGGRSRRMGEPKAWLQFGEETLLARTLRRLAPAVTQLVVVRSDRVGVPGLPGDVVVVSDAVEDQGPLQGLLAGLRAAERFASMAFVTATDAPFVSAAYAKRLRSLAEGHDIAMVDDGDHRHALCAVYATGLHRLAAELLARDDRRVLSMSEQARTRYVTRAELLQDEALAAVDPELRALQNINTPAEYREALARWEQAGSPA